MLSPQLCGILRTDLVAFYSKVFDTLEPNTALMSNWHIEHLAWKLMGLPESRTKRLIINQPPRTGKSTLASVAYPMFLLGLDPSVQIICISHTADLAKKFQADRRRVASAPWFREVFPDFELSAARDNELRTTEGGGCFACGMLGGVTGRGADLIIIDDPLKGADSLSRAKRAEVNAAFDNQISTRLNQKKSGVIVLVMQRLHQDDLTAHVLEGGDWDHVVLPAIASGATSYQLSLEPLDVHHRRAGELLHAARDPLRVLEAERRSQGSLVFEAQYQQNPLPAAGNVIRREWICYFDEEPAAFERIIVSWDTASTLSENADYSVGTVWGTLGANYYLLDVRRGRWETPELRRVILALDSENEPDANLIEDTDIGRAVRQELHRTSRLRLIPVRPHFDKETRLLVQAPRFEALQVYLPRRAPWLGEYLAELLGFPNARHDDQVDSTSQALYWLTARAAQTNPDVRPPIVRRDPVRRDVVRRDPVRRDPIRRDIVRK